MAVYIKTHPQRLIGNGNCFGCQFIDCIDIALVNLLEANLSTDLCAEKTSQGIKIYLYIAEQTALTLFAMDVVLT